MERKSRIDATGAIILIVFMGVLGLNQVAVKIIRIIAPVASILDFLSTVAPPALSNRDREASWQLP
ncbi:MAG: hypothetical protein AAF412_10180, partial [Pseudomonadota bacterium]